MCFIGGRAQLKRGSWLAQLGLSAALGLRALPAAGAEAAPPARVATAPELTYSAPAGCPDRASWLAQVAARADGQGERAVRLVARVLIDAAGTSARLLFHGDPAERVLSGRSCRELSEAAALVVAIAGRGAPASAVQAVEPAPEATPPPTAPAPGGSATPAPAVRSLPGAGVLTAPGLEPAPAVPSTSSAPPEPDAGTTPSAERKSPWRWALGMGAEANGWLVPWPAAVFDAALAVAGSRSAWSARLGVSFASTERSVNDRSAQLRYWGARLELCPLALWHDRAWRWSACSTAQLGVTRAWGDERSALAVGTPRTAPLAGLELRTRLQAPLGPLRLEAEAGLGMPLLRQSFRFGAPEEVVFESPRVGLIGRAGIQVPLAGVLD